MRYDEIKRSLEKRVSEENAEKIMSILESNQLFGICDEYHIHTFTNPLEFSEIYAQFDKSFEEDEIAVVCVNNMNTEPKIHIIYIYIPEKKA